MRLQVTALCESSLTTWVVADVRLLTRVSALVYGEVTGLSENSTTPWMVASVGLLPRMSAFVCCEVV
jgi:hypothetical protein